MHGQGDRDLPSLSSVGLFRAVIPPTPPEIAQGLLHRQVFLPTLDSQKYLMCLAQGHIYHSHSNFFPCTSYQY